MGVELLWSFLFLPFCDLFYFPYKPYNCKSFYKIFMVFHTKTVAFCCLQFLSNVEDAMMLMKSFADSPAIFSELFTSSHFTAASTPQLSGGFIFSETLFISLIWCFNKQWRLKSVLPQVKVTNGITMPVERSPVKLFL